MKKIKCPECKKLTEWSEKNYFKPFCSERCRLLDLGAWASENRRIAGDPLLDIENLEEDIEEH